MASIYERYIEMMKESGFVPKKWGIRAKGARPFFLVDGLGTPRLFETGDEASRWAERKLTSFLTTEFDVVNLANAQVYRAEADEPKDQAAAPVAHQWKTGDRARIKEGVHWGSRTWGNFQLNCGDEIVVSGHSGLPSSVSFLRPYDNFPVSIKIEYIEYVPEPEMTEEPDHDADEPEPIAPDDTDYILDLIRSTIDDGYQANLDGDTTAVARAFGRIEGMLDMAELSALHDEGDE